MGATFHYEGGLHARIPAGIELECFRAWNDAWTLLPAQIDRQGAFSVAGAGSDAEYRRLGSDEGWILLLPPARDSQAIPGWGVAETRRLDGVTLVRVVR